MLTSVIDLLLVLKSCDLLDVLKSTDSKYG